MGTRKEKRGGVKRIVYDSTHHTYSLKTDKPTNKRYEQTIRNYQKEMNNNERTEHEASQTQIKFTSSYY